MEGRASGELIDPVAIFVAQISSSSHLCPAYVGLSCWAFRGIPSSGSRGAGAETRAILEDTQPQIRAKRRTSSEIGR